MSVVNVTRPQSLRMRRVENVLSSRGGGWRRARRQITVVAVAVLVSAGVVGGQDAVAAAAGTTTQLVPMHLCSSPRAGYVSCHGLRLVLKKVKATSGAKSADQRRATVAQPSLASGPAGGYTPGDLATAYGVNAGSATSQTVAIVDAYDDPTVRADLNAFDAHYG